MDRREQELVGVGDPLPDVSLLGMDGGAVRLRDWQGRKLVMYLWGSW